MRVQEISRITTPTTTTTMKTATTTSKMLCICILKDLAFRFDRFKEKNSIKNIFLQVVHDFSIAFHIENQPYTEFKSVDKFRSLHDLSPAGNLLKIGKSHYTRNHHKVMGEMTWALRKAFVNRFEFMCVKMPIKISLFFLFRFLIYWQNRKKRSGTCIIK